MSTLKVDNIRHNSATSDAITMASDGTCTAKLTNYPHRNLFLNGAVNVSQRGNSYASGYTYKADQWYIFPTGSTTTRLTTSPPDGFQYYFRFPSTPDSIIISQQIELEEQGKAGKYKNKTVTVSWYARSESSNTMYVDASFKNNSGGGNYTMIVSGSGSAQNITSSWARYSQTFTISATPHANNQCFSIMIRTPSGQGGTVEATGFQAEFGDTMTDFEHIPLAEEFTRCYRYYYRLKGDNNKTFMIGMSDNDNVNIYGFLHFPVPMRTAPTGIDYGGGASDYKVRRDTTQTCTAVPAFVDAMPFYARVNFPRSGHGWGTGQMLWCQGGSTSSYIGFSAEL